MKKKKCFVISPIGDEGSDTREHADTVFEFIITRALEGLDIEPVRADHLLEPGKISETMYREIVASDFCVAILSGHNPNVFYELAFAHAARRPVIILIERQERIPFDVQDLRCVRYDLKPMRLKTYAEELKGQLQSLEQQNWKASSPFDKFLYPETTGTPVLADFLTGGFIQVLIPQFSLKKCESGLELQLKIDRSLRIVRKSREKDDFARELVGRQDARKELQRAYREFIDAPNEHRVFDCGDWPLRYANGGALPLLRLDNIDYVCLFYRDVRPVGWNIANGASDSYVELYDPQRVIHREFGEELIIANHKTKSLFFYHPGIENIGPGYRSAIITAIDQQFPPYRFREYGHKALQVQWEHGPDRVRIQVEEDENESLGFFLNVTPDDNAIEVDWVAHIHGEENGFPSDVKSFVKHCAVIDGELGGRGKSFGRVVGLFQLDRLEQSLDSHVFQPDYFFDQCEGSSGNVERTVAEAVKSIGKLRSEAQREYYDRLEQKFDLCPITRALIGKYKEFRNPS